MTKPSILRQFLQHEAAGGLLLIGTAILAIIIANSPLNHLYFNSLTTMIGPLPALHWVNDVLMAVFFFTVGLEIKRAGIEGPLASWNDRILPIIAATAGMACPALIYLAVTSAHADLSKGWAIPSATDIAFALGVLALLGKRVPASLKLFLTTVAIVDDMGAVAIIALAYTPSINGLALLSALGIMAGMMILKKCRIIALWPYILCAICLWFAVHASGVHATIAGVLAAMMIPIDGDDEARSPLHRLEHRLTPWVSYGILPVFAFANAGVNLGGFDLARLADPLPLAIIAGLFLGKQLGIFTAVALCIKLRLSAGLTHATWPQIYGIALLCGIGFTMSLFIGGLAFTDPLYTQEVKIGVFAGSILSAITGALLIRFSTLRPDGSRQ